MQHLADLLAPLVLPDASAGAAVSRAATPGEVAAGAARIEGLRGSRPDVSLADAALHQERVHQERVHEERVHDERLHGDLLHELGADLPAGHLHVWGGPSGAGKTSFLLALLHGAAAQGRRVVYATYDLPAETLALRLLAMLADVDPADLGRSALAPPQAKRAARLRAALATAPFQMLPARGLGVASLEDRLVRMPFRAEVLAVDYLQAVVRDLDADPGRTLRDLAALAARLHIAVVCAVRSGEGAPEEPSAWTGVVADAADRVGWIAPSAGAGRRQVEVLRNRHGARATMPIALDPASGALHRVSDGG